MQAGAATLVQIEKPVYGGAFLARIEGKAVFVPLALPGEQACVRIVDDKRGNAWRPPAATSALAAAVTTSTQDTRRNSR